MPPKKIFKFLKLWSTFETEPVMWFVTYRLWVMPPSGQNDYDLECDLLKSLHSGGNFFGRFFITRFNKCKCWIHDALLDFNFVFLVDITILKLRYYSYYVIPGFTYVIPSFTYVIPSFTYVIPSFTHVIPSFTYVIPSFTYVISSFTYVILQKWY